jgi:thiol-disulfide isomerase/thioredoxin
MKFFLFFCIGFFGLISSVQAADMALGKPVPAFEIKTLDGKLITPASAKGRVLVINLWATWCAPCRKELPAIEEFYHHYHELGVDVVAVSLDDHSAIGEVKSVMKSFSFTAAMEKDSELQRFGRIWRVPVTFVIDQSGILRRNGWEGDPLVDKAILEKIVTPLLAPLASTQTSGH